MGRAREGGREGGGEEREICLEHKEGPSVAVLGIWIRIQIHFLSQGWARKYSAQPSLQLSIQTIPTRTNRYQQHINNHSGSFTGHWHDRS